MRNTLRECISEEIYFVDGISSSLRQATNEGRTRKQFGSASRRAHRKIQSEKILSKQILKHKEFYKLLLSIRKRQTQVRTASFTATAHDFFSATQI